MSKSKKPSKWTSKEKKHCAISWTEKCDCGQDDKKEIKHSLQPKQWCMSMTAGLPIFKNKFGRTIVHADYAYKEYMSGKTFEESIDKVKTYVNNVKNSYIEAIKKFRLETFIKICEQHYTNKDYELTIEELKSYNFTDIEIEEFTKHMSENGVLNIIEEDGKTKYMLKEINDEISK